MEAITFDFSHFYHLSLLIIYLNVRQCLPKWTFFVNLGLERYSFSHSVDPTKNSFYKQLAKTVNPQARAFDKEVKSYIYTFEGQHAKAILPAD